MASFNGLLITAIYYTGMILNALIFVRIIFSWLRIGPNNPITQFIYNITEMFLGPVRKLLSKSPLGQGGMMLDFSPLITVLLINFISNILINIVRSI
jgi:YggT family protein